MSGKSDKKLRRAAKKVGELTSQQLLRQVNPMKKDWEKKSADKLSEQQKFAAKLLAWFTGIAFVIGFIVGYVTKKILT